ncbi:acyltransferase family protein [Terriglobus sp. RCC_193]|uniref:acyltransferase family protein n=1 Tax=Terriglobus sp. RCC_193 TaxID=3239218 RepID=UPI0035233D82
MASLTLETTQQQPTNAEPAKVNPPRRNIAVDAYRGLVMLLMMGEVLRFNAVSRAYPGSRFWQILAYNQSHVEWAGMSLHDTIQPGFTFLVGVALPYSIASRVRRSESFPRMMLHTLWRAILLIALGIFLRSTHSAMTNFTFEDTLTQIGLGYPIAFLLAFARPRWQWTALGVILLGYWAAWALYPLPGADFNYASVGIPADWHHNFTGFLAHWNKNSNLGQAFDVWFLNLFPREHPFLFNSGGYLTLSFIPTLGTMLLGLACGRWIKAAEPGVPMRRMLQAAAILIAAGLLLHFSHICPIVKRIWTPAWTLFSGGVCFLFLAALTWLIEVKQFRRWAFPLTVVGMNSIAAYLMAHLWEKFISSSFQIHLGLRPFLIFGAVLEPLMMGIAVMVVYWLILYWMFQRKLFLRI